MNNRYSMFNQGGGASTAPQIDSTALTHAQLAALRDISPDKFPEAGVFAAALENKLSQNFSAHQFDVNDFQLDPGTNMDHSF